MSDRTLEDIDADLAAAQARVVDLQRERSRAKNAGWHKRWSEFFPSDFAARLLAMAHDAAADCTSTYGEGQSEMLDIAPGVSVFVCISTNIEDTE